MNTKELVRDIVDYYNGNTAKLPTPAIAKRTSQYDIVDSAKDFHLVVESMEIPMKKAPLTLSADYHIVIDLLDKNAIPDGLVFGINKFSLQGQVDSIQDFLWWVNDVLVKKTQPIGSLGSISITEGNLLEYKSPATLAAWDICDVWLSPALAEILGEFHTTSGSELMFGERYLAFIRPATADAVTKQKFRSVMNLVHFKSIRILTDLPVIDTAVSNQTTGVLMYQKVASTMILNSEDYDVLKNTNQLLIPSSEYKRIQMYGERAISSYQFEAQVYYKDGKVHNLRMAPGEYFMVQILFERKKHEK